jgi:outer membrane protein, heavy metal efflux system
MRASRSLRPYGLGAVLLVSAPAAAAELGGPSLQNDPQLRDLVREALEKRPEVAEVRARIAAEGERVPQSYVLPDPSLALGIQNDGFGGIQIGKMESSWLFVVASQTFPWFGKRKARADLAAVGGEAAQADLLRALLSVTADVERAYLDLMLARDRLALLARLEELWRKSEAVARVRYEAGEVAQSDLLRAQLERARLQQRRFALESEGQRRGAVLNRLRGHPLDEAIVIPRTLADLPDPVVPDIEQEALSSESASPELKKAHLAEDEADRKVTLAKKERWPDVTLSAGLMPRWGPFDTMWQAGIGLNLPIGSAAKQKHAVAESQARGQAARLGEEALRLLLRQRVHERALLLRSLVAINRLYRGGLLVQSETTASSTLLQYQVGRVQFASVLEALAGYLGDLDGYLESIASAQRIAIAEREISLDAPDAATAAAVSTTAASDDARPDAAGKAPSGM